MNLWIAVARHNFTFRFLDTITVYSIFAVLNNSYFYILQVAWDVSAPVFSHVAWLVGWEKAALYHYVEEPLPCERNYVQFMELR